ncbi:MAG: transposase [bacterium]
MPETVFQRRSIRLRGYDYSRQGAYFVTVCTEKRRRLFGTVVNGRMALNDAGRMVQTVWDELPAHYSGVATDAFVIMPDHIHCVVRLCGPVVGAGPCACPAVAGDGQAQGPAGDGQAQGPAPTATTMSLPDVVHRIKTLSTKRYIDGVAQCGWPRFPGKLWQRNYYEIIVRNETALANIRAYIRDNSANWDVLRYGEPRFAVGNRALLALPQTAFLASRGGPAQGGQVRGPAPTWSTPPVCVMSGFLSPLERAVFDACLADGTPMVQVLARGLPETFYPRVQRAIEAGRLLVITPFPATETRFSAQRAAWCNQYVLQAAERVVIGALNPDGMLACLLADLPNDKPISILERGA